MYKIFALSLLSIFFISNTDAQQIHKCYTDEYVNYLDSQRPGTKENMYSLFDQAKNYALNHYSLKSTLSSDDTIFRIPVVFHVVYNTVEENTSDALLESQMRVLNEDFRRMNADTTNTRAIFKDRAADIGFEFFFTTIDPNGNPTTGITRTSTTRTTFGGIFPSLDALDEVKKTATDGIDAWNTSEYLNIWICNTGGSILGYAYPPENAPNWAAGNTPADQTVWGVVISHQVIGYDNPLATGALSIADKGRTGTHEIGHYFGLRHIWGDSGFFGSVDCDITKDDEIDDTPHMGNNSQQTGCDFTKNTCTNGETPDEPDMPENYMDYSTEDCQNMFTEGQSDILRSMAVIGRPGLAQVICDEVLEIEIGDYIVVNGTDTFLITDTTSISLSFGDQVMFLNENNGFSYTNTGNFILNHNTDVTVTEDGEIESVKDYTSIQTIHHSSDFSIFPNPTNTVFSIETEDSFSTIELMDINGQIVKTFENTSDNNFEIDDLNNGIYMLSIYQDDVLLGVRKMSIIK